MTNDKIQNPNKIQISNFQNRRQITRRDFLKILGGTAAGLAACGYLSNRGLFNAHAVTGLGYQREALYYEKIDEETVKCVLCPHECVLRDGQRSFCRVREPKNGKLYTLVYELACACHVDPIEKKPIYHMLPGSSSFSIATAGCNSRCKYCQNWQISQSPPEDTQNTVLSCKKIISLAKENQCRSIAYTYSEPIIFYEYAFDTASLARTENIKNVLVTAGYINPEPLKALCKHIDACHVDLKAYNDVYLRDVCSQRLKPVLETLRIMKEEGVWLEIVNLIVPTLNDNMDMIREMCVWIKGNLGKDTPLHFSRFWPLYKLKDLPPTPLETLIQARSIAIKEGLNYVYIGNVENPESGHTYCPNCKKIVVKRMGYSITEYNILNSSCKFCGYKIAGIWTA